MKNEILTKVKASSIPQQNEPSHCNKLGGLKKKVAITPAENQATAPLMKKSDKALS